MVAVLISGFPLKTATIANTLRHRIARNICGLILPTIYHLFIVWSYLDQNTLFKFWREATGTLGVPQVRDSLTIARPKDINAISIALYLVTSFSLHS